MAKREKVDLFGPVVRTPRGWTELDRIRTRYYRLAKKVADGEASEREMEEASRLKVKVDEREKEAREKWAKSFKA